MSIVLPGRHERRLVLGDVLGLLRDPVRLALETVDEVRIAVVAVPVTFGALAGHLCSLPPSSARVWGGACHPTVAGRRSAGSRDGSVTAAADDRRRGWLPSSRRRRAQHRRAAEPAVRRGRRGTPKAVLAGTVDFDKVNSDPLAVIRYPAISVYCYRVSVDKETRPGWSAVANGDGIPRLPLRMHLLIAAWDSVVENELEWLGLTAQILESESILTGPMLDATGDWEPGDEIQVVTDDLALDSMSEAFQALTTDYRLSLPYVARVIRIDGRPEPTAEGVATLAARMTATVPG